MTDESQILIPDSFIRLHQDARGRWTSPRELVRERCEFCEDLAHALIEHVRGVHVEIGVDEQDVLQRCWQGLRQGASGVSEAEADWVVTRLAELLGWPWPQWLPHPQTGATS